MTIGTYNIDYKFLPTMGVKLLAGRSFEESRPMDDATTPFPEVPEAETGLRRARNEHRHQRARGEADGLRRSAPGGRQAGQALATTRIMAGCCRRRSSESSRIRASARSASRSIRSCSGSRRTATARPSSATTGTPAGSGRDIERIWKRIASDAPFDAKFSEDIIKELYENEEARAKTFAGFALLAVVVACLGLFGLAAFTAERRTKEIGIRKVLGARTRDIVRLLAWQFSKPVIIANLIAWPVAWWVMRDWLNGFDARIALGPTPFLVAGLLALAIAVGTIAGHAFKVARSNPIHALRYE